jgi:uridine kinase
MRALLRHHLFASGLVLRLALVLFVLPRAALRWYVPFMAATTAAATLDPWASFLAGGGDPAAFPYGTMMWLAFLPLTLACRLLGLPIYVGYGMTLLAADLAVLAILLALLPAQRPLVLRSYWWSPIVLVATYWLGLNDLLPIALLCLALLCTRRMRMMPAGMLCGAAVSAKLSMVLAIPFFVIYLLRNKALRRFAPTFAAGLAISAVLLFLPFLLSSAGVAMTLHNPEMRKPYEVALRLGERTQVYVLPLSYLLMLYTAWRIPRINFDLFTALFGLAFLLVVLLTAASPGWFVWIVPMLVMYQAASDRTAQMLVAGFSVLYAGIDTLLIPLPHLVFGGDRIGAAAAALASRVGPDSVSALYTAMTALGAVLSLRIWRESVHSNDWFRFSRKRFVLGIAGDSGAGKDTLVEALTGLFGRHSVAHLSGDDYHLWDRRKPMWQVMTHLNPMANDLERFSNDLITLTDGRAIDARHYDHASGQQGRPYRVGSNHIILASGLHVLYLPILRECLDLAIYLDMDEGMRRHLKIRRDVTQRGHPLGRVLAALDKREADSERFIRPQARYADLVMSVQPVHPEPLGESLVAELPRTRLRVRSRLLLNELSISRTLISVCGLHVDLTMDDEAAAAELVIEGDAFAEDLQLAARMLVPRMIDFLDVEPQWSDGVLGVMQLVCLSHINQALSRRLL